MLALAGVPALSAFRIERLLVKLGGVLPSLRGIEVPFHPFVDLERTPTAAEVSVIGRLLDHQPDSPDPGGTGQVLLSVPRPGTISPWSAKATGVPHVCGLAVVRRIERGRVWRIEAEPALSPGDMALLARALHDPMTESMLTDLADAGRLFESHEPKPHSCIVLGADPAASLAPAHEELALALSEGEVAYLVDAYARIGRDPTDVEVMMFAQANSEHCRHKIFNADWVIDGSPQSRSLFAMIRHTRDRS